MTGNKKKVARKYVQTSDILRVTFEKKKKSALETRIYGTCLVFSFGIAELKSTHYCLELAERFNHLYSHVSIDASGA